MLKTLEFLNSIIKNKNDYIVLGCSGGPDSMCLLHLLYHNNYKIIVCCIDHHLRTDSEEEFNFVKNYCKNKHIPFEGLKLENTKHENEAYYRKKRYAFYKNTAQKYNTNIIATAHHGDDLVETILMRLTRGTNLKGYVGFSKFYCEQNFIFIKPLIFYTKNDILAYNQLNKIPYYIDRTNEEDNYTRNRYRHHILPMLKKEQTNVHLKYLQFSEELMNAKNYIDSIVENCILENYHDNILDLTKFTKLDEYIQKCELSKIMMLIYKDNIDKLKKVHLDMIIKNLKSGKNFTLNLPNLLVQREYTKLIFGIQSFTCEYLIEFQDYIELPNGWIIQKVLKSNDESNYTIRLNSQEITLPLYIRNRKTGDNLVVKGEEKSQKVKKIMIDKKVEPSLRNSWPLVFDSKDNLLWLPGLKKSKFDNDKSKNYDIILRYERKEIYEK